MRHRLRNMYNFVNRWLWQTFPLMSMGATRGRHHRSTHVKTPLRSIVRVRVCQHISSYIRWSFCATWNLSINITVPANNLPTFRDTLLLVYRLLPLLVISILWSLHSSPNGVLWGPGIMSSIHWWTGMVVIYGDSAAARHDYRTISNIRRTK